MIKNLENILKKKKDSVQTLVARMVEKIPFPLQNCLTTFTSIFIA